MAKRKMYKVLKVVGLLTMAVFLLSLFTTMILQPFSSVQAQESWLTGWQYRKSHVINAASDAGTDYQVRIKTLYNQEPSQGLVFKHSILEQYITLNAWDAQGKLFAIKQDNYGYFKLFWATDGNPDNLTLRWTPPVNFSQAHYIRCLFIDSRNYIFIGAWNPTSGQAGWFWRSTDAGQTFTQVLNIAVWHMTEDADGYLYIGRYENGINACQVYKSTDGGANWTDISTSAWRSQTHVHNVVIEPSNGWLYVTIGDTSTSPTGVWRSKLKNGSDWVFKGRSDSTIYLFVGMAAKDGYIYLGSDESDGRIWRFQDDGTDNAQTFTLVQDNPLNGHIFYLEKDNTGRLWAGILNSVAGGQTKLLTSDNGTIWVERIVSTQTYAWETFQWGTVKFSEDSILLIQCDRKTLKAWFESYIAADEVDLQGHCRTDFGDVRFTDDDGTTLLDYWIEEKFDGEYAVFWVKVADDLSTDPATIYICYGNPSATTTSNRANTFLFFDDFSTNTLSAYTETYDSGGSPAFSYDSINQRVQGSTTDYKQHHLTHNTFTVTNNKIGVKIISGEDGGVTFRFQNQNNLYVLVIADSTYDIGACFRVYKRVGGSWTEIGAPVSISNTAGSIHQLYLGFYGQYLYVWWDGILTINGRDLGLDYSSGKFGPRLYHGTCYHDDLRVSKFVYPEPSHGSWGSEEEVTENNAPTISEFQAPAIVYANKYFLLNATINDPDGVTDLVRATVELEGIILKWENEANAFTKLSDPNNYCILDPVGSFKTQLNATAYKLSWKIKPRWTYPEGPASILPTNTKIFDSRGASSSGNYVNLFTFEDDLIVYSASVDDSRINPSQSITFSGTLYYQGTTTPPEDTLGITAKVNLGDTLKGLTTSIGTDGTFSVSFAGELNVAQYSYTVYAITDENTVQNQTVKVIVDKIQVQSYTVTDDRVNINDDVNIDVLLHYDYDDTAVTDGSVTINGISATHQAGGVWRITQSKSTVQAVTYNTVAVSGNTYGITVVDQNEKSTTVIWDRVKVISYSASDTRANVGENVNIDVIIRYEYDNTNIVDGNVIINTIPATHQGNGVWRITQSQLTVQAVTYDTIACSGNTYGITVVNQNNQFITVIWDRIKVISLTASHGRIDVGSPATLTVQLVYEYDNTAVSSGSFTLNGLTLTYENGVWVTIDTKNSVSATTYDRVNGADGAYGLTLITVNGQSTTVIWDRVVITLSISDNRIDIGTTANIVKAGFYEYDSTPFTGTITLNDTTTKNTVGRYGYKVSSIFDPVYGLTVFTTNEVYCIFDKVNIIKFEALDNRINVGDTAIFRVEGVYEYDSTPWIGSYELNDTATKTIVGKYWYKIVQITDSNYGLTVFQQTTSDAYVIIDRINVVSYGSDDTRRDVNTEATFYLTLEYEYDGTLVTDGIAYFNGSLPLAWSNANSRWEYKATKDSVQKLTVYLVEVTGNSYGITALNPSISSKTITVIWDQIKITDGGVTKETLTLDETVIVWFRAIYEYDGTPFTGNNGTLYLNGTQMTWSSTNVRWEYVYTADVVGTVTFKISAVLDSSQNLTTINDAVGAKTITIWSMPFSIISNSIITELYFNSSSKIIIFKISGQDGTTGYINITIAKTLIEDISELKIYLDDEPINYTLSYTNNFWLIHFTYHHSTHKVVIRLGSTFATKPIETYANPLTAYDLGIVTFVIFTAMKLGKKKKNRKSAKTI